MVRFCFASSHLSDLEVLDDGYSAPGMWRRRASGGISRRTNGRECATRIQINSALFLVFPLSYEIQPERCWKHQSRIQPAGAHPNGMKHIVELAHLFPLFQSLAGHLLLEAQAVVLLFTAEPPTPVERRNQQRQAEIGQPLRVSQPLSEKQNQSAPVQLECCSHLVSGTCAQHSPQNLGSCAALREYSTKAGRKGRGVKLPMKPLGMYRPSSLSRDSHLHFRRPSTCPRRTMGSAHGSYTARYSLERLLGIEASTKGGGKPSLHTHIRNNFRW